MPNNCKKHSPYFRADLLRGEREIVSIRIFRHNHAMTYATPDGTMKFSQRFPDSAKGNYRPAADLTLSSLGLGTYLGNHDEKTDANYVEAIVKFVESGGNVIDTAANYRFQRSERNIGAALEILWAKGYAREELFVSTKGGYLPFDSEPPRDVRNYFQKEFVEKGIAGFNDLVSGSHCMTPAYLQSQLDQSLRNMKLDAVELFYIHNPESQLAEIDRHLFELRIAQAFEALEQNCAQGKIKFYGVASWNGFRVSPNEKSYHSLERFVSIAKQIGGENHGFRFIQLPHNLAMPEAFLFPNQAVNGKAMTTLEAAKMLGISVMCSASILQGKLAHGVSSEFRDSLGNLKSDALTGIQFVRSTPNVTTALIGMSSAFHVEENMSLSNTEPLSEKVFRKKFARE